MEWTRRKGCGWEGAERGREGSWAAMDMAVLSNSVGLVVDVVGEMGDSDTLSGRCGR